ncbi:AzlD domain-containing protein [Ruegeria atlantica]|uniref:Putative membrane protein n=1 Tax=Ruegeria atlantica TaxID=81569 RepID=A0A0P1EGV4_9RHOB|nr:AzlD domain-containing protein [Ruegeria atlantica]CUH49417.1 putative membrane protein [Ruegeria atlantica]
MTPVDPVTIWSIIIGLAIGSYSLRFVFIGLVGDRPMPPWLLRHLRYTAVAILPALIAPLVVWPTATEGQPDIPRMAAAAVALSVGVITKNVLAAIFSGAAILYVLLYLLG